MKSPFPGMDPYIETSGYWGDFHSGLIALIQQHLADVAPEGYYVHTNTRDYLEVVEQEGRHERALIPDVSVRHPKKPKRTRVGRGTVATVRPGLAEQPIQMRAMLTESYRERFVEIFHKGADGLHLVTAIEVLSPANKAANSRGRKQYLEKRQGLLLEAVNFVELDLLRGGERMPMIDEWPDSPYVLMVNRMANDQWCHVWRGYSHRPLPCIPVPLRPADADLSLELQPMVDTVYRRGRYRALLDYSKPLPFPHPEDAACLEALKSPPG
jgi:hypothetical protein